MEKKKILFRIRSLEMGGVVRVLIDILKNISKEHLEITVLVNLDQGELKDEIPKDIRLISICRGKEDMSQNQLIQKIQLTLRLLKLKVLNRFPSLMKIYYKEIYDTEIAFGKSEVEMVLKSPQKQSKKIAWVHWEFSHEPELNKSDLMIQQLQKFDHVVFCSENVRKQVKELYGVDFLNSTVIHNVIYPDIIQEKSKQFVSDKPKIKLELFKFSSIGRVQNNKGYPVLLKIHKRLMEEGLFHQITIIGNGDKLNELKEKSKVLGVEDTFLLLGNKNNPFPYIIDSDFFILPTQSEAYPLSIKEALVLGIPLLVCDVGGVNEILTDNIDGLLMDYDEEDIYNKMKLVLTDESLVNRLKEGALRAKDKFEIGKVHTKIEKLLIGINCG